MPGKGGSSSGRKESSFNADYSFDIFSLRSDLTPLTPTTFSGAIENFKGAFNDVPEDEFDFAKSDIPVEVVDIDTRNSPLTLNLAAKELKAGDPITLLSGAAIIDSGGGANSPQNAPTDRIEFTLSSDELANLGVDEFTLIIDEQDTDPNSETEGIQVGEETIVPSLATANGSSQSDAIEYIIDNNLFSLITDIRVSGGDDDDSLSTGQKFKGVKKLIMFQI